MKTGKIPAWVRYLISYMVFAALFIWLIPIFQGWLVAQTQITSQLGLGMVNAVNMVYWVIWMLLLLFRTHQSTRMGKEGVYVCGALLLLSVILMTAALLQNDSWTAKIFLAAEELYDLVMLLRARRNTEA